MILKDVALVDKAQEAISQGINAEKAWIDAIEFFVQMMESISDETMSNRAAYIRDFGHRDLSHLMRVDIIKGRFKNL